MYRDSGQEYTIKSNRAGIISQKRNYIMYEDVDQLDRFRQKKPIIEECKLDPSNDPLDNYRYYEDLTLRDKRKKSLVKHERTSEPVGRETPFDRDSFKRTIINSASDSNNLRSYSNKSSNKRKTPRPVLRDTPRPVLTEAPRPVLTETPRPVLRQAPNPVLRQASRPELKQGLRPEFIPSRKGSKPDLRQGPSLANAFWPNEGPGPKFGLPRRESEPYLKQKYIHSNYIKYFPYQSQINNNRCPTCGRDFDHEKSNRENHTYIRQLYVGPQRTYNFRTNKTQIKERKQNYYDCYESEGSEDESDYNYKYKQINCVKHQDSNDSKTFHRLRKKGGGSSYENIYRKAPRFDGGFSNLYSSSSYCRFNGYK